MKKATYPDEKTNTMKPFTNVFNLFLMSDCGTPSETGYTYAGTTATTYQGTSSVSCAAGYSGIANPTTVICEDTGSWTNVSGCTIQGTDGFCLSGYMLVFFFFFFFFFFFGLFWHELRCYFLSIH